MKIERVSRRGLVFTFADLSELINDCLTNVYVINGDNYYFICDTFLGSEPMNEIKKYLNEHFGEKQTIIFNSHHHWDHYWGNYTFSSSFIIAHEKCQKKILETGQKTLEELSTFRRGEVVITPPNVVFKKAITFLDEGVKFFYSPGHTEDSASCFDLVDNVLYAGDNLEAPIPYITSTTGELATYLSTLCEYRKMDIETIIPGHGQVSDKQLLHQNLQYLESFPELLTTPKSADKKRMFYAIHINNLTTIGNKLLEQERVIEAQDYFQKALDLGIKTKTLKGESIQKLKEKIILCPTSD